MEFTIQREHWSISELAQYLGKSYMTVYWWVRLGKVKSTREGRKYRIHWTEVERLKKEDVND